MALLLIVLGMEYIRLLVFSKPSDLIPFPGAKRDIAPNKRLNNISAYWK